MKKNFVAMVLLMMALLLCGCDDNDGPDVNTESQGNSEVDSQGHATDSWVVAFDSIGKVFCAVDNKTYDEAYDEDAVVYCIISSEAEWLYWADENIPGWKTCAEIEYTAVDWEKECVLVSETTKTSNGIFSYVNPIEKLMMQAGKLVITHTDEEISELVKIQNDASEDCCYRAYEVVSIAKSDLTEAAIAEYPWSEKTVSEVEFYAGECVFHKVTQEEYENRLSAGMVLGIASTKEEWEAWANENFSEWKVNGILNSYNEKLFEKHVLLVYQCEKKDTGMMASTLEQIYSDGQTLKCIEKENCDVAILDDSLNPEYYIPYQICWVKKDVLSDVTLEKYDFEHFYHLDKDCAYYVYLDVKNNRVRIDATRDGGFYWEQYDAFNGKFYGGTTSTRFVVHASFVDTDTAFIVCTRDKEHGSHVWMHWKLSDGGNTIEEIKGTSYPALVSATHLVFFDENVGYLMTNYVLSPLGSDYGHILYRTEDGGVTWEPAELPYTDENYENIIGITIERISETEGQLVLGLYDTIYGSTMNVLAYDFYTEDAGKTWKRMDNAVYGLYSGDGGENWKLIEK